MPVRRRENPNAAGSLGRQVTPDGSWPLPELVEAQLGPGPDELVDPGDLELDLNLAWMRTRPEWALDAEPVFGEIDNQSMALGVVVIFAT